MFGAMLVETSATTSRAGLRVIALLLTALMFIRLTRT
jgi:hypothetical protein